MSYAYFPGCSLEGMASEYDRSMRAVCRHLGMAMDEAKNWVCCGATPAHATSHLLSLALPAKSLSEAWKAAGRPGDGAVTMVAACASCYSRLRTANHEIRADEKVRAKVQKAAETDYAGQVEVKHLLDVMRNDVGVERIRECVSKPLAGLKVACYYGCLLVRPPKVVAFDDADNPRVMDEILEAAGATCVDWPYKTECCGASFGLSKPEYVVKLANDILTEARDAGAQAIAVACPLCQANLDLRQSDIARKHGTQFNLPVLYFTQLLGLAFGLDEKALGLGRLIVSPASLVRQIGAME